ncbi:hypothetical protein BP6252_09589 [Coleophoma cylindrospora]|uniref:Uncharacterized protein n=1 Tax=Coleophoma cylindrospora TaxID=1849047 RepID=A0A3D8QWP3_9HELO|nr:hypothetical protein BP6252_09589 [Coleophoma cylindrospora]
MAPHLTAGESAESQAQNKPKPKQDRPQQLPQTHRGPRRVNSTNDKDKDKDDDDWSDSQPESEGPPDDTQTQTAEVRRKSGVDRVHSRQRPRQSGPAVLVDNGGRTRSTGARTTNHPNVSYTGGQAVPYGYSKGYFPSPNLFSAGPFPPYHGASTFPTGPYSPNIHALNLFPPNPYPSKFCPSGPYQPSPDYSAGAYPTSPYVTPPYRTSPHGINPYASNPHYPTTPYAADPTYLPSQGIHHQFQPNPGVRRSPYSVDNEVQKVKRELENLKTEESARRHQEQDRRRMEEYWKRKEKENALEKEKDAKQKFEKLKRQKDHEAKAQHEKILRAKRAAAEEQQLTEVIKRTVERETREALEKMVATKQEEDKLRVQDANREQEKERMLIELMDFIDERRRLDSRSWDGGSVRESLGGSGRGRLDSMPPEFVAPGRAAELTRTQIEQIVLEILQRRLPDLEPQIPFTDNHMFSSGGYHERPLRRLHPRSYTSEPLVVDKSPQHAGARGTEDISPELLSPRFSDRYASPEFNGSVTSPRGSTAFQQNPTRQLSLGKRNPSQSRAPRGNDPRYQSDRDVHDGREVSTRDLADNGFPFFSDAQDNEARNRLIQPQLDDTVQNRADFRGGKMTMMSGAEAGHSKHRAATAHFVSVTDYLSNGSDTDQPRAPRSSRHTKYTSIPTKESSSNRLTAPPAVPDPPSLG